MSGTPEYMKGVTHCYPHGKKMPCGKCAEELTPISELIENEE